MNYHNSTYRLRRLAIPAQTDLLKLLVAGLNKGRLKRPLGYNGHQPAAAAGTVNMLIIRSNVIYLLQVKFK